MDVEALKQGIVEIEEVEDLQAVYRTALAELYKRFAGRKETCKHPVEMQGRVEVPRSSNHEVGCTYCLTPRALPNVGRIGG